MSNRALQGQEAIDAAGVDVNSREARDEWQEAGGGGHAGHGLEESNSRGDRGHDAIKCADTHFVGSARGT